MPYRTVDVIPPGTEVIPLSERALATHFIMNAGNCNLHAVYCSPEMCPVNETCMFMDKSKWAHEHILNLLNVDLSKGRCESIW